MKRDLPAMRKLSSVKLAGFRCSLEVLLHCGGHNFRQCALDSIRDRDTVVPAQAIRIAVVRHRVSVVEDEYTIEVRVKEVCRVGDAPRLRATDTVALEVAEVKAMCAGQLMQLVGGDCLEWREELLVGALGSLEVTLLHLQLGSEAP